MLKIVQEYSHNTTLALYMKDYKVIIFNILHDLKYLYTLEKARKKANESFFFLPLT